MRRALFLSVLEWPSISGGMNRCRSRGLSCCRDRMHGQGDRSTFSVVLHTVSEVEATRKRASSGVMTLVEATPSAPEVEPRSAHLSGWSRDRVIRPVRGADGEAVYSREGRSERAT